MEKKDKIRVGVLRGGEGEYYDYSLRKGGEIISYLHENLSHKYKPIDILVDRNGVWHAKGVPILPVELLHKVDVVWNLSQQSFSNILESFSIPTIGVPPFSSFFRNSREMLGKNMKKIGIKLPRHIVLPVYQKDFDGEKNKYIIRKAKEVFEKFPSPWIVRSFTPDANMGIHLAKTFPELVKAIEDGVEHGGSVLVEEFIAGKVATVHSVPGFRGEDVYTFPLGNTFGDFSSREKEKLVASAKNLQKHVGARHYLKSDFVLSSGDKVYLLEVDLTPDLGQDSHFSQACFGVGAKTEQVVDHILETALR